MDRNVMTQSLSSDDRQIDVYQFSIKNKLGKGMFGTVFKATDTRTQQSVAIKIVDKEDLKDPEEYKGLMNEIFIMRSLQNQNIVQIMDVIQSENNYYLVMEYCNSGDLEMALRKSLNIDHYRVLINVLSAFIVLIKQGIMHRDLKPANILMHKTKNDLTYKLGDFGFARLLRSFKREMLSS
jgi:serine/threonine protein kinase